MSSGRCSLVYSAGSRSMYPSAVLRKVPRRSRPPGFCAAAGKGSKWRSEGRRETGSPAPCGFCPGVHRPCPSAQGQDPERAMAVPVCRNDRVAGRLPRSDSRSVEPIASHARNPSEGSPETALRSGWKWRSADWCEQGAGHTRAPDPGSLAQVGKRLCRHAVCLRVDRPERGSQFLQADDWLV